MDDLGPRRTPFDAVLSPDVLRRAVGVAGGIGIGVPVALVFAEPTLNGAGLALGALALVLTAFTVTRAGRATSDGRAVLGVFLGCFLPPTLLFAPTGVGVMFSAPAGLIASFAVLPLVLALRSATAMPRDDDAEHLAVLTAAWLTVLAVAAVALRGSPAPALCAVLVAAALPFAAFAFVRDASRGQFLAAVRAGRHPGLVLEPALPPSSPRVRGIVACERLRAVATSGDGPFRSLATSLELGAVRTPSGRIVSSVALFCAAGALAVVLVSR